MRSAIRRSKVPKLPSCQKKRKEVPGRRACLLHRCNWRKVQGEKSRTSSRRKKGGRQGKCLTLTREVCVGKKKNTSSHNAKGTYHRRQKESSKETGIASNESLSFYSEHPRADRKKKMHRSGRKKSTINSHFVREEDAQ